MGFYRARGHIEFLWGFRRSRGTTSQEAPMLPVGLM